MRSIIKIIILVFTVINVLSCSKSPAEPNRMPPPPPLLLAGQESQLDGLTWLFYDGSFDEGVDHIYLQTPVRPDLFPWSGTCLDAGVLMKFDTASNWIDVKPITIYDPGIPVQYLYGVNSRTLLVDMFPPNYQLIGKKAAIKIKFL